MRGTVFLAAGVAGLALTACGQSEKKQAAADAKASGFVPPSVTSRLDYGGQQERRFRQLDRNGDDALDQTELPRPDARVAGFDRDGDGRVTLNEYSQSALERFDRMDLNRDGTVTSEERKTSNEGRRR